MPALSPTTAKRKRSAGPTLAPTEPRIDLPAATLSSPPPMAQSHDLGLIASLRGPFVVVAQIVPQALVDPSELQQLNAASRLT